jgi:hypothetical protein
MRQVRNQKRSCQVFFLFLILYIYFFWGGVHRGVFNRCVHFIVQIGEQHVQLICRMGCRGDAQVVVDQEVAVGGLQEVERNLQGLMIGIPPLRRREVLLHLQRHTVGVSESLNSLLR